MPNLNQSEELKKIKTLLGINRTEANAKLTVCMEMAVEQILREFRSSIGKRLVRNIPIKYKAAVENESSEMCYIVLPEDCRSIDTLFYGRTEMQILDPEQYIKWQKSNIELSQPFVCLYNQMEDGTSIVEFFPSTSSLNGDFVDLVYNVSGKDMSVFPERYRRVMMYGAAKEYLLFDTIKRDPAIHSKIKSEYEAARGELTLDQLYGSGEDLDRKPLEQQRWEDSYNDFGYSPNVDIRLR